MGKKEKVCHHCNGTTKDREGDVCLPCRGEGILAPKDNRRLALYWQALFLNGKNTGGRS